MFFLLLSVLPILLTLNFKLHYSNFTLVKFSGLVTKSCLALATPWTVACQAPLSMGFSRQEYLSGFPFPSPGDLPDSRIKPEAPTSQADSLLTELRRIKS